MWRRVTSCLETDRHVVHCTRHAMARDKYYAAYFLPVKTVILTSSNPLTSFAL